MATAQLIDHTNYDTLLIQSTNGRSGTPNGNIYFNTTTGEIEIITREELAQVDLGSGLEDNPLTDYYGITMRALYNFERRERRIDENLRKFDLWFAGSFKYAGAYEVVKGRKFASSDREKIRGSGWIEKATNNNTDRIYFGVRSLNAIDPDTQPYYQFVDSIGEADLQAASPSNFSRLGPIDESIQVFGSTANGDIGAGNLDSTQKILVISVRKFGNTYGRTNSIATGLSELNAFSTGFGIGEAPNDANSYNITDVFGVAQITPWTGMRLEVFASNQQRSGFTNGTANFDIIISNSGNGTLQQVRAFLDALSLQDTDIDEGSGEFRGKRANELYSIDTQGRVVTAQGLHIDNLQEADKQSIVQTDVTGVGRTYPFNVQIEIEVGEFAVADPNAWYQVFYSDGAGTLDFNTETAVTVQNSSNVDVKGNVSTSAIGTKIIFSYAYDTNTQAGLSAATDKEVIVVVEGDGGATAAKTIFTITRRQTVSATCSPSQETNA
jgi:hypothetical protein